MGKAYDHRIKTQIALTGNPHLFSDINIPRTTRATWVSRGVPDYVQLDEDVVREAFLRDRVDKLERRVATLRAVVVLLVSLIRVKGLSLKHTRVPAEGKARLLGAVAAARPAIGFTGALKVIGLSSSRYIEWERRARGCELQDQSSCPHSHPFMLLPRERFAMKGMVLNLGLRHMSLRGLALHAQRVGTVFCHPSTWYKMIRRYEWKRPRTRIEPNKPKHGVRTTKPNELWHIDVTIVRLVSGAKAFVHAAIDNYSRKILAWRVYDRLSPMGTFELLREAEQFLAGVETTAVAMDAGVENLNRTVDPLRLVAACPVFLTDFHTSRAWRLL